MGYSAENTGYMNIFDTYIYIYTYTFAHIEATKGSTFQ